MDNSDDLQNRLDRIGKWTTFNVDWAHFRKLSCLDIVDLCALSVGVHPEYARLVRGMTTIDLEEHQSLDEIKAMATYQNDLISEWERRVVVAVNHAKGGALPMLSEDAENIVIKIADFVAFARGFGWPLPDEFSCLTVNGDSPLSLSHGTASSGQVSIQSLGGKAKDIKQGNSAKRDAIRAIWASGKYTSRDRCAEEECSSLDMAFSTARKALKNTPEPD